MLKDDLSLSYHFIRNNWKMILIASIGFILALATVSETNIVVDSYRRSLVEEFFSNSEYGYEGSDFEIALPYGLQNTNVEAIQSSIQSTVDFFSDLGKRAATRLRFNKYIEQEIWRWSFEVFPEELNESYLYDSYNSGKQSVNAPIQLNTFDSDSFYIFKDFLTSGELPKSLNEVVIITDEQTTNTQLGDTITLSVRPTGQGDQRRNVTVIVTGIIEYGRLDSMETNTSLDYLDWFHRDTTLLTSPFAFIDFAKTLFENNTFFLFEIDGRINIDVSQLDAFDIATEKLRFELYRQGLEFELNNFGYARYLDYYIHPNIIWRLETFEFQLSATLTIMWLFILPTIIIPLFLANFTLSLLYHRKRLSVSVLKTRGSSMRQIFVILGSESLIMTFLSIGLGTFLGMPFALLILKSRGFLDFTGDFIPLMLSPTLFQPVMIFGIILAILINLRSIVHLSRIKINEGLLPQEKRKPYWKKYYLDLVLFVVGLFTIFVMIFISNSLAGATFKNADEELFLRQILSFFSFFFGIPGPILFAVGGAMLFVRIHPILIHKLARWTWKLEGGIIGFSFRKSLHNISHAGRAILLISIALAFSIGLVTVQYSGEVNVVDNIYYQTLGADMIVKPPVPVIRDKFVLNQMIYNTSSYLQNFTDIASVSPIGRAGSSYYEESGSSLYILGIDPKTYGQTAFFREDFLNPDVLSSLLRLDVFGVIRSLTLGDLLPDTPNLGNLISKLQSNTEVLVQEDNLKNRNLNTGDQFPWLFKLNNETSGQEIALRQNFDVVGKFKYWPLLIHQVPNEYSSVYMVTNLSTVLECVNAKSLVYVGLNYLVRVKPGVSMIQLKEQIVNETGYEVQCIEEFIKDFNNSPTRNVLYTTINSSFLMLMIVVFFTVLMFSFSQLKEREKEIGVERALGMSLRQISFLFFFEALVLILFAIGIGILIGIVIGQLFLSTMLTAQAYLFPPFVVKTPWILFGAITGIIVVFGVIASLIPAFLATRLKISKILRTE
ncbi:MAG: ABC transporter permease [Promethearchaeota archaeon]